MDLGKIRTDRFHQHKYWFQIVYEWEDEFSKALGIPLVSNKHSFYDNEFALKVIGKWGIYKLFQWADRITQTKVKDVYFDMGPRFTYTHAASPNVIPIIIDFWKYIDLKRFNSVYANCPLVCISSLEALEYIKESGSTLRLAFLPLSLPDKYQIDTNKPYEKDFDFVMAGRKNPVLQQYLQQFAEENPEIEYITTIEEGKSLYYHSNKQGIVGPADTHEQYLEMIKRAKIAFYATPGIDGGEVRTGGFNPVTPRLFELLYAGCHVIGRYPKTIETDYFQLDQICPAVQSYDAFKDLANQYLSKREQPLEKNRAYLQNHYTSKRAALLKDLISNL